jgi:hypothetical protein
MMMDLHAQHPTLTIRLHFWYEEDMMFFLEVTPDGKTAMKTVHSVGCNGWKTGMCCTICRAENGEPAPVPFFYTPTSSPTLEAALADAGKITGPSPASESEPRPQSGAHAADPPKDSALDIAGPSKPQDASGDGNASAGAQAAISTTNGGDSDTGCVGSNEDGLLSPDNSKRQKVDPKDMNENSKQAGLNTGELAQASVALETVIDQLDLRELYAAHVTTNCASAKRWAREYALDSEGNRLLSVVEYFRAVDDPAVCRHHTIDLEVKANTWCMF